jgi:hypothetical protein
MKCSRIREMAAGYVLGALDPDEMIAVQDHLDNCAQDHSEITELGGVLPYLAEALPPAEPPAWLRDSVLDAARADLAARRRVGKPSERRAIEPLPVLRSLEADEPAPRRGARKPALARIVSFAGARDSRRRRALEWATRVAAAVAIVSLAGYTYILQGDLDKARRANQANASMGYYLSLPDTRTGVLTSHDSSKAGGMAALRPTGSLMISVNNLPITKGDEVYMVWLTADNGAQWKVGYFTVDDSGTGLITAENVPASASLWVFICKEPNEKVTKPTGPTIVSGAISV